MATDKYLAKHAEVSIRFAKELDSKHYDFFLLIPAYDENENFAQNCLQNIPLDTSLLTCLIFNTPLIPEEKLTEDKQSAAERTILAHDNFLAQSTIKKQSNNFTFCSNKGRDFIVLNYCAENSLPYKKGVGLARKIAADLGAQVIHDGKIQYPWICSSDADAVLPVEYFSEIAKLDPRHSFAIFPHEHINAENEKTALATQLRDISLDYYERALEWAGSPYDFIALGSTITINAKHYAQAHGFPQRAAGEDFYLLNKLAKLASWTKIDCPSIQIQTRISQRVPFGTGPNTQKILELEDPIAEYLYYHPQIFSELKTLLASFPKLHSDSQAAIKQLSPACLEAIEFIQFHKALKHAKSQSKSLSQFEQYLHQYLDAFQSLKFIHFLRDNYFDSINLQELRELSPLKIKELKI